MKITKEIQRELDRIEGIARELQAAELPPSTEYGTKGVWLLMSSVRESVSAIERELLHA